MIETPLYQAMTTTGAIHFWQGILNKVSCEQKEKNDMEGRKSRRNQRIRLLAPRPFHNIYRTAGTLVKELDRRGKQITSEFLMANLTTLKPMMEWSDEVGVSVYSDVHIF